MDKTEAKDNGKRGSASLERPLVPMLQKSTLAAPEQTSVSPLKADVPDFQKTVKHIKFNLEADVPSLSEVKESPLKMGKRQS